MKNKVLVIGLDGATFRVMEPLMKKGKLPVLSRLAAQGARGVLQSTLDTNSPCAWSTFITGKNPGKHGIFGFFENMPGSYQVRFLNGSFRHGQSLWRILSDEGKRVGIINVPFSYPVEEVNGFMIGGPDSPNKHDQSFCYPKGVVEEAEHKIGPYIIEAGANALVRQGRLEEAIEKLKACIEIRASTAEYFLSREAYDFFMVVFTESDRVQHHFWKFMNPEHPAYSSPEGRKYAGAVYQIYERLDEAVGRVLAAAGDEYAVLIMSDHGAGPASNKTFFLNRWLNTAGYLSFESGMSTKAVIKGTAEKLIGNAYVYVNSRFSRRWKRTLRNLFPGVKNRANSILRGLKIDWDATQAFSWENAPTIFINVKGKFPHGIVNPGREYEDLVARLTKDLLELKVPGDGAPIVEKVVTKEEAYWGPFLDKAPDLFIEWREDAYTVRPGFAASGKGFIEEITGERLKKVERISRASGVHKPDGIFLFSGPGVVSGRQVPALKLYDVTSMVLYYLGVPIPEDFDGRVVEEAFLDQFLDQNIVNHSGVTSDESAFEKGYTEGEAEIIARRLQGLGYID